MATSNKRPIVAPPKDRKEPGFFTRTGLGILGFFKGGVAGILGGAAGGYKIGVEEGRFPILSGIFYGFIGIFLGAYYGAKQGYQKGKGGVFPPLIPKIVASSNQYASAEAPFNFSYFAVRRKIKNSIMSPGEDRAYRKQRNLNRRYDLEDLWRRYEDSNFFVQFAVWSYVRVRASLIGWQIRADIARDKKTYPIENNEEHDEICRVFVTELQRYKNLQGSCPFGDAVTIVEKGDKGKEELWFSIPKEKADMLFEFLKMNSSRPDLKIMQETSANGAETEFRIPVHDISMLTKAIKKFNKHVRNEKQTRAEPPENQQESMLSSYHHSIDPESDVFGVNQNKSSAGSLQNDASNPGDDSRSHSKPSHHDE